MQNGVAGVLPAHVRVGALKVCVIVQIFSTFTNSKRSLFHVFLKVGSGVENRILPSWREPKAVKVFWKSGTVVDMQEGHPMCAGLSFAAVVCNKTGVSRDRSWIWQLVSLIDLQKVWHISQTCLNLCVVGPSPTHSYTHTHT